MVHWLNGQWTLNQVPIFQGQKCTKTAEYHCQLYYPSPNLQLLFHQQYFWSNQLPLSHSYCICKRQAYGTNHQKSLILLRDTTGTSQTSENKYRYFILTQDALLLANNITLSSNSSGFDNDEDAHCMTINGWWLYTVYRIAKTVDLKGSVLRECSPGQSILRRQP